MEQQAQTIEYRQGDASAEKHAHGRQGHKDGGWAGQSGVDKDAKESFRVNPQQQLHKRGRVLIAMQSTKLEADASAIGAAASWEDLTWKGMQRYVQCCILKAKQVMPRIKVRWTLLADEQQIHDCSGTSAQLRGFEHFDAEHRLLVPAHAMTADQVCCRYTLGSFCNYTAGRVQSLSRQHWSCERSRHRPNSQSILSKRDQFAQASPAVNVGCCQC